MFGFLAGLTIFVVLGSIIAACVWYAATHRSDLIEAGLVLSGGALALICALLLAAMLSGDIQVTGLSDGCYRVTHGAKTVHYDTIACP